MREPSRARRIGPSSELSSLTACYYQMNPLSRYQVDSQLNHMGACVHAVAGWQERYLDVKSDPATYTRPSPLNLTSYFTALSPLGFF